MSTPPAAPPPLRRDAERNRRRVLDAARRLVAERGRDVGYAEIARAAGVGVGTVYRRFPTRERLLHELYRDRVDAVVALLDQALAVADPWQGLCQFLEGDFALQVEDRGLREFLLGGADSTELRRIAGARIAPRVAALVERAGAAGALRPGVGPGDIALILAMVGGLLDASAHVDPDLWRRYLAVVLAGLETGDGPDELPGASPDPTTVERILAGWELTRRGQG